MEIKNEAKGRLIMEIKVIPAWAWALALVIFVSAQVFFNYFARIPNGLDAWVAVLAGIAAGVGGACYVLFIGYISRDAQRRGMSALIWVLVAIFVTNGLGVILYFLLRQPISGRCPQCAGAVQPGFGFCPHCSYQLSRQCVQCHREVRLNDIYCPSCGSALEKAA
jgi:Double zinc ribbon